MMLLGTSAVKDAIHTISSVLEIPAIIVLIAIVVIVIVELGSLLVELFGERMHTKVNAALVLEQIKGKDAAYIAATLEESRFLKSSKRVFSQLLNNTDMSVSMAETLSMRLIATEELRKQRVVSVTDVIARIGPMFGLMATLIPLGPGLIALGQGDTKTLSDSLLTAFDATVSGLAAAGVAFIISRVRKRWYEDDLISLEAVMEAILNEAFDRESKSKEGTHVDENKRKARDEVKSHA
jgi:biopolymer transport protein ExbB/TolQ